MHIFHPHSVSFFLLRGAKKCLVALMAKKILCIEGKKARPILV